MKTRKVLCTIDVMTEAVVKELNSMNEKIEKFERQINANASATSEARSIVANLLDVVDKKPNKSAVQTIAKHLINLESRVADLEKEKCNCYPNEIILFHTRIERAKPQADYFLKAKNLLIEYAEKTMIKKGVEYTPVGDRFANFRPILGEKKTDIEKLIGYNAKHVQYCFMQESNMTAKTISELLEHWGDVFNYNVLGLAMQNTDRSKAFVVPYADRPTQEKDIKDIVDSVKEINSYGTALPIEIVYQRLLNSIHNNNLPSIIYLFAQQLERLENSK